MKCPKCEHELASTKVADICPNCDYIKMKKEDWKGEQTTCPKCSKKAKVYKHTHPGKSFMCEHCNTVGRYFDEKSLHSVKVRKDSELGKRLSWLFEVPCHDWKRKEDIEDTICKKCDMKEVCKAHVKEIQKLSDRDDVDIYFYEDFIEVVHK